jgi:hypothetical protein
VWNIEKIVSIKGVVLSVVFHASLGHISLTHRHGQILREIALIKFIFYRESLSHGADANSSLIQIGSIATDLYLTRPLINTLDELAENAVDASVRLAPTEALEHEGLLVRQLLWPLETPTIELVVLRNPVARGGTHSRLGPVI